MAPIVLERCPGQGTSSSDKGSRWRPLLGKCALVLKLLTLLLKMCYPSAPNRGGCLDSHIQLNQLDVTGMTRHLAMSD